MNELVEKLNQFKNITIDIIKCVESEEYDSLDGLIENRASIINDMDKLSFKKEEFEAVCNELQIPSYQDKLNQLMKSKMYIIKQKIKKVNISKNVNINYTKGGYVDSLFFSKKI